MVILPGIKTAKPPCTLGEPGGYSEKNDIKTGNYLLPGTIVTITGYCVKKLFSRRSGVLKNLDTAKDRVLLFPNFVFYMPYRNVENRSVILFII
jgi:hypothetical protein